MVSSSCSKDARKTLLEERPGINTSTLNALISVKWKVCVSLNENSWVSTGNVESVCKTKCVTQFFTHILMLGLVIGTERRTEKNLE